MIKVRRPAAPKRRNLVPLWGLRDLHLLLHERSTRLVKPESVGRGYGMT